jgi:hypothetical protein
MHEATDVHTPTASVKMPMHVEASIPQGLSNQKDSRMQERLLVSLLLTLNQRFLGTQWEHPMSLNRFRGAVTC